MSLIKCIETFIAESTVVMDEWILMEAKLSEYNKHLESLDHLESYFGKETVDAMREQLGEPPNIDHHADMMALINGIHSEYQTASYILSRFTIKLRNSITSTVRKPEYTHGC